MTERFTTFKRLAPNKAPGLDGFTGELFKSLQDIVKPTLLQVYNGIWSGGPYLLTGNQAIIKLLSKKRKNPLEPGSYRPILLLNLDVKILSQIVTARLANILPSLINPAQYGFVRGRTATLNIHKVMMVREHAKANPGRYLDITLDAEKAFNNVSFDLPSLVLTKLFLRSI